MTSLAKPKQAEIYLANLNPGTGSEQTGTRPVLIISGNTLNENMPICIVCPLSSKIKNFSTGTIIRPDKQNNLRHSSEVISFQVRTISTSRLGKKLGVITEAQLQDVLNKLNNVLKY